MTQPPDNKPGFYYVTALYNGRHAYLAGPFKDNHQAALDLVDKARAEAEKVDPRAFWYAYGTARLPLEVDPPAGKLNTQLGVTA